MKTGPYAQVPWRRSGVRPNRLTGRRSAPEAPGNRRGDVPRTSEPVPRNASAGDRRTSWARGVLLTLAVLATPELTHAAPAPPPTKKAPTKSDPPVDLPLPPTSTSDAEPADSSGD